MLQGIDALNNLTNADEDEYPMSDIIAEAGNYSYLHMSFGTSNTRYPAWHQIKLELQ